MINASSAFLAANAKLNKQPIWVIEIEEYSRIFSNAASIPGAPGGWLNSTILLGLQTVNFNVPFSVNGTLSGYSLPAGVSPSSVTKIEAIIVAARPGGIVNGLFGFQLSINGSLFFNDPNSPGALGEWNYDEVLSPSGTYTDPTTFPFSTVSFVASLGANLINTYNDSGSAGCVLLVTYGPLNKQVILLPSVFTPYNPSGAFGTGTVAMGGPLGGTISPVDWLSSINDLKLTVSDLDGGADLADLVFNVVDVGAQITADMGSPSNFVFEGKECRLYHGFAGMSMSDFILMFRGVINTVSSDKTNQEYQFDVSSINLKKLTTAIYTTGDDGFTTASKHPKTLNGHPLDMLVDALTQAGVDEIDTAKINFYKNGIFNGLEFTFTLTSAPTAKNFIEAELMKPLGLYLWEAATGLVSLNSFYPALSGDGTYTPPPVPAMTLDQDTCTDIPLVTEADLIDQVIIRFDDDGTGSSKYLSENIAVYDVSVAKYGLTDGQIIESTGLRSAFQGYYIASIVSRLIFLRYGSKNLVLDPQTLLWNACLLEPGDIIALNSPYLPNRSAGVLGFTGQTFEVLDRTWQFKKGTVQVRLLQIDIANYKQYLITPNAEPDYTAAGSTDQGKYMFLCGPGGTYSNGNPANTLG